MRSVGRPKMILGIDESGRGPVLGDLVISGVLLASERVGERLVRDGVRDSKELTRKKRELLYPLIEIRSSRILTKTISPATVDAWRSSGKSLNELEAKTFAEIILQMQPEVAIVDCADVLTRTFSARLKNYLGGAMPPRLVCEHFADKNYPSVSAASIVAKVTRDREMEKLSADHGELGSGYCHDKRTLQFLDRYYTVNGRFPSFVRKTWITASRIMDARAQTTLPVAQSFHR